MITHDEHYPEKTPNKVITYIIPVINALVRFGHFPIAWKKTNLIIIKKRVKDERKIPDSYRTISLLFSLSKVFKKFTHSRLTKFLDLVEAIFKIAKKKCN